MMKSIRMILLAGLVVAGAGCSTLLEAQDAAAGVPPASVAASGVATPAAPAAPAACPVCASKGETFVKVN